MGWRRLSWVVTLGCAAAVLTGCGPGWSGVIGLSVDDAGKIIVVLQDCKGDIDEVKLRAADDTVLAVWANPRSPKGVIQFPLMEGADRWRSEHPVPPLDDSTTYSLTGRESHDSSKAVGIDFTPAMLKSLSPGQVMVTKVGPQANTTETVSLADFTPADCG
jgi:hypothetical protein